MSDKKDFEISVDELENVSGGCNEPTDENLPSDHGSWVGKYDTEAYIGKVLYFVKDKAHDEYFLAKLYASYEHDSSSCKTVRVYDITVKWCSKSDIQIYKWASKDRGYEYISAGKYLTHVDGDELTAYEYTGTQYS